MDNPPKTWIDQRDKDRDILAEIMIRKSLLWVLENLAGHCELIVTEEEIVWKDVDPDRKQYFNQAGKALRIVAKKIGVSKTNYQDYWDKYRGGIQRRKSKVRVYRHLLRKKEAIKHEAKKRIKPLPENGN